MIGLIIGLGIAVVAVIFVGYFIGIYNSFIMLKHNIEKAWANIDVLLKQRFDELPKLVASVKGYMKHEKSLLVELTKARTQSEKAASIQEKAKVSEQMSGIITKLFAVAENYPNLKANENFMQLQGRISDIENQLSDRREFYNDSVNTFNIRTEQFPYVIIANWLKYAKKELFRVTEAEKKDVKIEF